MTSESKLTPTPPSIPESAVEVAEVPNPPTLESRNLSVGYKLRGKSSLGMAVTDVNLSFYPGEITGIMGPSGCGKSSYLRALNRMSDLYPDAVVTGQVLFNGWGNIYDKEIKHQEVPEIRRAITMVFQHPSPLDKSIYDNVAFGLRVNGYDRGEIPERVEDALRRAFLWDEVSDKLRKHAYGLSGGQQQRMCIARALAIDPEVLLLDEPTSALDHRATYMIEELMQQLKKSMPIVWVSHDRLQVARVADKVAFLGPKSMEEEDQGGQLVEYGNTKEVFTNPQHPLTESFVLGKI